MRHDPGIRKIETDVARFFSSELASMAKEQNGTGIANGQMGFTSDWLKLDMGTVFLSLPARVDALRQMAPSGCTIIIGVSPEQKLRLLESPWSWRSSGGLEPQLSSKKSPRIS
jgi:hypothetical protein